MPPGEPPARKRFLFLQGPVSPFFQEVGAGLRALGHAVHRINLHWGDRLFWRGPGAVDFHGTPAEWPAFVGRFLDEHRITQLVLLGEQRPYHKVAIAEAAAREVEVVATDLGYIRPDWIVMERDGLNASSRFTRDPEAIIRLGAALPPPDLVTRHRDDFRVQALWDVAYNLAGQMRWPGFRHYRGHQIYHPIPFYFGILRRLAKRGRDHRKADRILRELSGTGPLYLMALQMENDFSIRAYSRYTDMDTPLREVSRSFAQHAPAGTHLLVKAHPLDPGLKNWGQRVRQIAAEFGLQGRMHYLGGGNLGAMVEQVQGVVTVNSTVGLRAILGQTPTFALGEALYRIPGLVFPGTLDRFWTEAPPPDPALREGFLRAVAHSLHIRGVYHAPEGRRVAVEGAVRRLHEGILNRPVPEALDPETEGATAGFWPPRPKPGAG
jgi:capsular polysaccharide export protein